MRLHKLELWNTWQPFRTYFAKEVCSLIIIANRPGKKASPSPQGLAQGIAVPKCVARGTAIPSANPKGAMHLPGREGCNFPHIFVFSSSFLFSMLNTPITPSQQKWNLPNAEDGQNFAQPPRPNTVGKRRMGKILPVLCSLEESISERNAWRQLFAQPLLLNKKELQKQKCEENYIHIHKQPFFQDRLYSIYLVAAVANTVDLLFSADCICSSSSC